MKDKDLDILLSEYRKEEPTDIQMQKWKQAVRREVKSSVPERKNTWNQLLVASLVGFIVGALVFKTNKTEDEFQTFAKNDRESATIEYVYTNSN